MSNFFVGLGIFIICVATGIAFLPSMPAPGSLDLLTRARMAQRLALAAVLWTGASIIIGAFVARALG